MNSEKEIVIDRIWVSQYRTEDRPRRKTDAVVFKEMTQQMEDAVSQIELWHRYKETVESYKMMKMNDIPAGKQNPRWADHFVREVEDFRKHLKSYNDLILFHCATDFLIDNLNLGQIDKGRRLRNGTAKKNILKCLNEFCIWKGWGDQFT